MTDWNRYDPKFKGNVTNMSQNNSDIQQTDQLKVMYKLVKFK